MSSDALALSPLALALFLAIVPVALLTSYKIRQNTNYDYPTDFATLAFGGVVLAMLAVGVPTAWPVLIALLYAGGYYASGRIVDRQRREFLKISEDGEGNIRLYFIPGQFFEHPKHGLCRVPETNAELFNQMVRRIYHKVIVNAPLRENVTVHRPKGGELRPEANVIDDLTGVRVILIEDIHTQEMPIEGLRIKAILRTTHIKLAHGEMIPKIKLLTDMKVVDNLNDNISKAVAKANEVETKIIPQLPMIGANQLTEIARNNPIMEVINKYFETEDERRKESK